MEFSRWEEKWGIDRVGWLGPLETMHFCTSVNSGNLQDISVLTKVVGQLDVFGATVAHLKKVGLRRFPPLPTAVFHYCFVKQCCCCYS